MELAHLIHPLDLVEAAKESPIAGLEDMHLHTARLDTHKN
jgi:hypothetical protein